MMVKSFLTLQAKLIGTYVGIADLLAALRKSQQRFQDAGRGPGSAAHPMGKMGKLVGR